MSFYIHYDGKEFHAPSFRQLYAFMRDIVHENVFTSSASGKPTSIVDVGANIGSTVLLWQSLWPGVDIVAIEPYPESIVYLKKNTDNITIIEKAASNFTGTLNMSCYSDNTGLAKVTKGGLKVPADKLDNMVERCDFLKIDVEGHEFEVLEGATRLLKQNPYVLIETDSPSKLMFDNIKKINELNYLMWNNK